MSPAWIDEISKIRDRASYLDDSLSLQSQLCCLSPWVAAFATEKTLETRLSSLAFLPSKMAAVAVKIAFSCLFLSVSLATEDAFHEELIIRPLSTGHVYTHFQFSTVWHVDVEDPKACKLQNFARKVLCEIKVYFYPSLTFPCLIVRRRKTARLEHSDFFKVDVADERPVTRNCERPGR